MDADSAKTKNEEVKDLTGRCSALEAQLEEKDRIIERLCERDIVLKSLPYAVAEFLKGRLLDEGLKNIMNRLERAYAVKGVCLLKLSRGGTGASVLASSPGCDIYRFDGDITLSESFPAERLESGFVVPDVSADGVFADAGFPDSEVVILVPVIGKRSFFGSLCVIQSGKKRIWEEVETDTLAGIASILGIILEFDELKRKIEKDREDLESLVEERTSELKLANTALKNEANRRKKAQIALRSRHKILREMYNRIPVGAVIIRTDGTFDFSNHYFRFMTGYAKKELNGLSISDILESTRAHCFDDNGVFRDDIKELGGTIRKNGGKKTDVRINSFPLQNENENGAGIVCLLTDLSRQKEQEHRERMMKIQLTKLTLELEKLKAVIMGETDKPKNMDIDTFGLTKREKETLLFALQGYRTKEISKRMGVVEVTIRKNLTSIFRKLEVRDRYELIEKYRSLVFGK